jgi:hypothetical protein
MKIGRGDQCWFPSTGHCKVFHRVWQERFGALIASLPGGLGVNTLGTYG